MVLVLPCLLSRMVSCRIRKGRLDRRQCCFRHVHCSAPLEHRRNAAEAVLDVVNALNPLDMNVGLCSDAVHHLVTESERRRDESNDGFVDHAALVRMSLFSFGLIVVMI